MTDYDRQMEAIQDAAFALLRLSSAYNGPLGTTLYNIAADVGDRMRKAKREVIETYHQQPEQSK